MLQRKNLDNRIRKYMNCRNTMHENIKKAALNDRGRGVIRKEILHINYSANSKLVWRRDPPGEIITFIQHESPCWIEENQTDQETDPLQWLSNKGRRADALALRADERRDKLRKAAGSCT